MEEEKKMYAWMPVNCERFCETYGSIEEAVAEAQNQWDEKYEYYEEEGENSTEIYLMVADQFDIEKSLERYGEDLKFIIANKFIVWWITWMSGCMISRD